MKPEKVRETVAEATVAAGQLADHLERMAKRLAPTFPLSAEMLETWGDEERERLHAFLRMFEQAHELTAKLLFRGIMTLSSEDPLALSARNLVRRMEKLWVIDSADAWLDLMTVRNELVHDYPTNSKLQAHNANRCWEKLPTLIAAVRQTIAYIEREGLLN